jgi:hypothetical protein
LKTGFLRIAIIFPLIFLLALSKARTQSFSSLEKQIWGMASNNWKLNNKWIFNQDLGLMHTYTFPNFTRIFLRSQINYQLSGTFSFHGGLIFIFKYYDIEENAMEIRPWVGTKIRWPSFWRINLVHYIRIEDRFRHTYSEEPWDDDFRVRYKLSTAVPINHESLIRNTFYGVLGYEFFSVSYDVNVQFTTADLHRFDVGLGFNQNVKNRYEVNLVAFKARDEITNDYDVSSLVMFLKYKRYINWE